MAACLLGKLFDAWLGLSTVRRLSAGPTRQRAGMVTARHKSVKWLQCDLSSRHVNGTPDTG